MRTTQIITVPLENLIWKRNTIVKRKKRTQIISTAFKKTIRKHSINVKKREKKKRIRHNLHGIWEDNLKTQHFQIRPPDLISRGIISVVFKTVLKFGPNTFLTTFEASPKGRVLGFKTHARILFHYQSCLRPLKTVLVTARGIAKYGQVFYFSLGNRAGYFKV